MYLTAAFIYSTIPRMEQNISKRRATRRDRFRSMTVALAVIVILSTGTHAVYGGGVDFVVDSSTENTAEVQNTLDTANADTNADILEDDTSSNTATSESTADTSSGCCTYTVEGTTVDGTTVGGTTVGGSTVGGTTVGGSTVGGSVCGCPTDAG